MTAINDVDNFEESDLFAMKLDYNTANNPQYNGNIGGMSWTSTQFPDIKAYDFDYDGLNRLTNANFANNGLYTQGKLILLNLAL